MGFFTPRERAELGESLEVRGQGRVREPLRRDYTPRRTPRSPDAPRTPDTARSPDAPRGPDLAGHVGTLMQRVSETSLREIDELIAMLKRRREKVLTETVRMQRDIVEYAKLNQSTIQSVKVISDSLAHLKGVPDASHTAYTAELPAVAEVSDEEHSEAVAELDVQPSADDDATSGEQVQDVAVAESQTAVDESPPSERPAPSDRPE
jgi:hypothetical protein